MKVKKRDLFWIYSCLLINEGFNYMGPLICEFFQ